ncbi:MAG TPA: SDR family NAD(P)-dependent oxidoreductase [Aggregatilineales bacterium]|nr:SDR family NAD(P)-dependent oxidoreductase [Aggregatilineales bacterium]
MDNLKGKVALVTGASRGVGKGVALSLGEAGATVYVTGRTRVATDATVPLDGTVEDTAKAITERGGKGIAHVCDHNDDQQVESVFKRIQSEMGQLDIVVNNAWKGYEGWHNMTYLPPSHPFWERGASFWDDNLLGLRWAYVSTIFAIPIMLQKGSGLIVNISFGALSTGNPAYNIAKSGTDRLTAETADSLRDKGITAVSLHPGLVRTEGIMLNVQYFDMSNSESPEFTGRAVVALAKDEQSIQKSGQALVVARLAQDYNFDDIDGKRPTPIE